MRIVLFSKDIYFESYLNSILPKSEYQVVKGTKTTQIEIEREVKSLLPDICIFDSSLGIPEIAKIIEKLIFVDMLNVMYVSKTFDISMFYNVINDEHFTIIQYDKINAIEDFIKMVVKYNRRINLLEKKLDETTNQLNDTVLVNKAKAFLMKKGYTEEEAFKYIQRQAMDKRQSKAQVAKEILKG